MTALPTLTLPASQKFVANHKITSFINNPADATVIQDIGWVDMRDYGEIVVTITTSVLGGNGPTAFHIYANTNSAGTGNEVILKTHAVGSAPNALNDMLVLSVTAEEIAAVSGEDGYKYRYVSAVVDSHHADDECIVHYIQVARHAQLNLTGDIVA